MHSSDNPDLLKRLLLGQSSGQDNNGESPKEKISKGNHKNNPINFYLNQSN